MKCPNPYKTCSKISLIDTITTRERRTVINNNKLKFVTNLVIGKKMGSQNPIQSITSAMIASCFDITLLNCWQYKIF